MCLTSLLHPRLRHPLLHAKPLVDGERRFFATASAPQLHDYCGERAGLDAKPASGESLRLFYLQLFVPMPSSRESDLVWTGLPVGHSSLCISVANEAP